MFDERDRIGSEIKFRSCGKSARIGDKVLICAGLVDKGHMWKLLEAEVVETSISACKVRYTDYKPYGHKDPFFYEWVAKDVIVDVVYSCNPVVNEAVEAAKFLWETYRHKDCFSGKAILEKWPWLKE